MNKEYGIRNAEGGTRACVGVDSSFRIPYSLFRIRYSGWGTRLHVGAFLVPPALTVADLTQQRAAYMPPTRLLAPELCSTAGLICL